MPCHPWRWSGFDESEQAIGELFTDRDLSKLLFRRLGWSHAVSEMAAGCCQEIGNTVIPCRKLSPGCSHSGIISASIFTTNSNCPFSTRKQGNLVLGNSGVIFGFDFSNSFGRSIRRIPDSFTPVSILGPSFFEIASHEVLNRVRAHWNLSTAST